MKAIQQKRVWNDDAGEVRSDISLEKFVWQILGAETFIPSEPTSSLDLLEASLLGVNKLALLSLADVMEIPMKDMAGLLNLSYKTLSRKNESDPFDSVVSSQSIEIANTVAHGIKVFEDEYKFRRWLHKENRALRGKRPFDLLKTPTGIRMVNQILGRIDEGVYS
ncbi:type II RES/Xre toxin-antitoxin system antitoxin [Dyadobacter luticola]|nr:antitoxin Xre/MbcA/ParS toxin-binding domain-containing protein [Dyadobacter luticola]